MIKRFWIQRRGPIPAQCGKLCRMDGEKSAAVDRFVEETVTRDALHFQSTEKCSAENSPKMAGQILEHILVSGDLRGARIALQEGQAGSATETFFKIIHVGPARFGLFSQTLQLHFEDRGLEFGDAIVEANQAVAELVGDAGASAVHIGLCALVEFEIVRNN